tara:strand:- start:4051 stop:5193 length:1143 start_codon:yes stop_codon:yes gene_type:complete
MKIIKIPKNRIRKLRTLSLGEKAYEFKSSNSQFQQNYIDLCSNDYLGLSRNIEVINAAYKTTLKEGLGSGSSRFISGTRPIHQSLESELGKWLNKEKILLFPSGFQANIAAMQALANRDSIIITDKLIHHSLLVGAKSSGAKLVRFFHNDLIDLEKKILKYSLSNKNILVTVESLYSMEGTISPLEEIAEICKKYNCRLLVDEAHALGILGSEGRGLSYGCKNPIDIISGTLGKAFGSGGAFLACNSKMGDYLIQTSGAFRYTTAISPSLAAGALQSLREIKSNKNWGLDLLKNSRIWRNKITNLDKWPVKGDCQILSLIIGDEDKTLLLQRYLEDKGFLAVGIRPPTIPRGQSRIRITIRRTLDLCILDKFISALKNFK